MPLYVLIPLLLILFGGLVTIFLVVGRLSRRVRAAADAPPPPPPPPPPPREDAQAREQLGRLEAALDELAAVVGDLSERVGKLESGWGEEAEALREGFAGLQAGFEALAPTTAEPAPEPLDESTADPAARVLDHLAASGLSDVVLLPDAENVWRVEARREGVLVKGRARLFPDGRVESRLEPPTRAFP